PLIGTPWVRTYVLVFSCSSIAIAMAIGTGATGRVGWRAVCPGVLAGGAVAGFVIAAVLLRGTSLSEMIDGVLLAPMRQPGIFSVRYRGPPGADVVAGGSLVARLAAGGLRGRYRSMMDVGVAALRIIRAGTLRAPILRFPAVSPDYLSFGSALPCLW